MFYARGKTKGQLLFSQFIWCTSTRKAFRYDNIFNKKWNFNKRKTGNKLQAKEREHTYNMLSYCVMNMIFEAYLSPAILDGPWYDSSLSPVVLRVSFKKLLSLSLRKGKLQLCQMIWSQLSNINTNWRKYRGVLLKKTITSQAEFSVPLASSRSFFIKRA